MEVTAKYELIGLMAYPIRHSLSPTMQNCALEKMGLPICYMAFEVDNASFPDAIKGLRALKMRGTGVSMPTSSSPSNTLTNSIRPLNSPAPSTRSSTRTAV